jgi:hypothetical protein
MAQRISFGLSAFPVGDASPRFWRFAWRLIRRSPFFFIESKEGEPVPTGAGDCLRRSRETFELLSLPFEGALKDCDDNLPAFEGARKNGAGTGKA